MKKFLPYLLITAFVLLMLGAVLYQKYNPPVPTPTSAYTAQKASLLLHDYAKEAGEAGETVRDETVYAVMLERPMYEDSGMKQAAEFCFFDINGVVCTMGSNDTEYVSGSNFTSLSTDALKKATSLYAEYGFSLCGTSDYKVPGMSNSGEHAGDEYNVYVVTGRGIYRYVFTLTTVPAELTELSAAAPEEIKTAAAQTAGSTDGAESDTAVITTEE